jgi:dTDP-4-amino-4,6-dideoxygalactose transaminase
MPISDSIAERVLCLPLYVGLETKDIEKIVSIINNAI